MKLTPHFVFEFTLESDECLHGYSEAFSGRFLGQILYEAEVVDFQKIGRQPLKYGPDFFGVNARIHPQQRNVLAQWDGASLPQVAAGVVVHRSIEPRRKISNRLPSLDFDPGVQQCRLGGILGSLLVVKDAPGVSYQCYPMLRVELAPRITVAFFDLLLPSKK